MTVLPVEGEPDMVVIRTRKRQRRKRKKSHKSRVAKRVVIIVAIVVVVIAAIAGGVAFMIHKGNENLHKPQVEDVLNTVEYGGHTYEYNENVVSVLVMGVDDGTTYSVRPEAMCNDVNLLVTMDTSNSKMSIVAIPRDTLAEVDIYDDGDYVETKDLQLACAYSVEAEESVCAENAVKSVSRIFSGLNITQYFVIEEQALEDATTAIGGVQLEALATYPEAEFEVGDTVLLQGEAAFRYVQYRDKNQAQSAQDRLERQIQFSKAFLSKVRQSGASGIVSLYNSTAEYTHTNLTVSDISYLASCYINGDNADVSFVTLTGETQSYEDSDGEVREHIVLDEDSVMQAMLGAFYTQTD